MGDGKGRKGTGDRAMGLLCPGMGPSLGQLRLKGGK